MFYRTQNMVLNGAVANGMLSALMTRPAAALLTGLTMRLYTDPGLAPSPATPFATFTEATFDGYLAVTLATLIGPVSQPPSLRLVHGEGDFAAGAGIGAGATVYGYYLTDAAPTLWYAAEQLVVPASTTPAPFNFANPGDFLSIDAAIGMLTQLALNL